MYNKSTKLEIVAQLRAKSQHSELVVLYVSSKTGKEVDEENTHIATPTSVNLKRADETH